MPVIEAEPGFFQMRVKRMLRYPIESYRAMLGIAPKKFNAVNMLRAVDNLIASMMPPEMFGKTHVNLSLITAPTVGIDDALDADTASNGFLQRCFGSIGNNPGINLVHTFQNVQNDVFPTRITSAFTSNTFCTVIGFV